MEKRTWRARLCSNYTAGCNQPREKRKREEEEGGVDTEKQLSVSVRRGGRRHFLNQRVVSISNWVLSAKKTNKKTNKKTTRHFRCFTVKERAPEVEIIIWWK